MVVNSPLRRPAISGWHWGGRDPGGSVLTCVDIRQALTGISKLPHILALEIPWFRGAPRKTHLQGSTDPNNPSFLKDLFQNLGGGFI